MSEQEESFIACHEKDSRKQEKQPELHRHIPISDGRGIFP
jgi:hypothetical protein